MSDRVERCGRDHGIDPRVLGDPDVLQYPSGLGVDDPGEQRHPAVDDPNRFVEDLPAHPVGAEGDLPGGTEHEQAVDAGQDQPVDEPFEGPDIQSTVVGERGDDRGATPVSGRVAVMVVTPLVFGRLVGWRWSANGCRLGHGLGAVGRPDVAGLDQSLDA